MQTRFAVAWLQVLWCSSHTRFATPRSQLIKNDFYWQSTNELTFEHSLCVFGELFCAMKIAWEALVHITAANCWLKVQTTQWHFLRKASSSSTRVVHLKRQMLSSWRVQPSARQNSNQIMWLTNLKWSCLSLERQTERHARSAFVLNSHSLPPDDSKSVLCDIRHQSHSTPERFSIGRINYSM